MVDDTIAAVEQERDTPLNPRQKMLVVLLLEVKAGKLTMTDALRQAGYAGSTAEQQSSTLNRLREYSAIQKALREAGFNEEAIAKKLTEGLTATRPVVIDKVIQDVPDPDTHRLREGVRSREPVPTVRSRRDYGKATDKIGWNTDHRSKAYAIDTLKKDLKDGRCIPKSHEIGRAKGSRARRTR